jgi:hypothetical protein
MVAIVTLNGSPLFAAEPAPAPVKAEQKASLPAPPPAAAPAKDQTSAAAKPGTTDSANPAKGDSKGPSPQRFIPSEQVRADFDVSFPIDI